MNVRKISQQIKKMEKKLFIIIIRKFFVQKTLLLSKGCVRCSEKYKKLFLFLKNHFLGNQNKLVSCFHLKSSLGRLNYLSSCVIKISFVLSFISNPLEIWRKFFSGKVKKSFETWCWKLTQVDTRYFKKASEFFLSKGAMILGNR